jgi:hypothetical protein
VNILKQEVCDAYRALCAQTSCGFFTNLNFQNSPHQRRYGFHFSEDLFDSLTVKEALRKVESALQLLEDKATMPLIAEHIDFHH